MSIVPEPIKCRLYRSAFPVGLVFVVVGCGIPAFGQVTTLPPVRADEPAPGTTGDTTFRNVTLVPPRLNASGDLAFMGQLQGPGVDSTNEYGIWLEGRDALRLVARHGEQVAGIAFSHFDFFKSVNLDADGRAAFVSGLDATGSITPRTFWAEDDTGLRLVAAIGAIAPGTGGTFARLITSRVRSGDTPIFSAGRMAFLAEVIVPDGQGGTVSRDSVWAEFGSGAVLLNATGDVMPGIQTPVQTGLDPNAPRTFSSFKEVVLNDAGVAAFTGTGNGFGGTIALYRAPDAGTRELIASNETVAPGTSGSLFHDLDFLSMNSAGAVAFRGVADTGYGFWAEGDAGLRKVALEGEAAPDTESGVNFVPGGMIPLGLGDNGRAAVWAQLDGAGVTGLNREGIWAEDGTGALRLVARTGQSAPGTETGVTFADITAAAMNAMGHVAFRTLLVGASINASNNPGIWAQDRNGELVMISRTGKLVETAPGVLDFVAALKMDPLTGTGRDGLPSAFNASGQLTYGAELYYGKEAVFVANADADATDLPLCSANFIFSGTALDAVNTFTGELTHETVDLNLGGPMPLVFMRHYGSRIARSGTLDVGLGLNWMHNFSMTLVRNARRVEVVNNRGRLLYFELVGGQWELKGPLDVVFQLVEAGNTFVLGDPAGLVYTFALDVCIGRLTRIEDGHGNLHQLTYDAEGRLLEVSDGLGRQLTFTYAGDFLSSVSDGIRNVSFEYAGDTLIASRDALNEPTEYAYDGANPLAGLLTSLTMPRGNAPFHAAYHTFGAVASLSNVSNQAYTFDYTNGTTVSDPLAETTRHVHDFYGRLTSFTDENNQSVSMEYDEAGRRTRILDRLGGETRYAFHEPSGRLASVTEADGGHWQMSYAPRTFAGITLYDIAQVTYPDGMTDVFDYDASGNPVTWTDRAGKQWLYTYDDHGQVLTTGNPTGGTSTRTYNGDGTAATFRDHFGNPTTYTYDSSRRVSSVGHPDGTTRAFEWSDRDELLNETNGRGDTRTFAYDANGNLVSATDTLQNTSTYEYDDQDRLVSATDPLGKTTQVEFDARGRPATMRDRSDGATTFAYDPRGRLQSVTDDRQDTWSFAYDPEGIITSSTALGSRQIAFTSDAVGRIVELTSSENGSAKITYDAMDRIQTITDALGKVATYTYDARGLLTKAELPGNVTGTYGRNDLGNVTSISDPNGAQWLREYDAQGRLVSSQDPLGFKTLYEYDSRSRVSHVDFPEDTGALDIAYDGNSNPVRLLYSPTIITPKANEEALDLMFTYDSEDRLVSAEGIALAWDPIDRITGSNGLVVAYDNDNNIVSIQMASGQTITYTYTQGRLTEVRDWLGGVTKIRYTPAGFLSSFERPNGAVTTYSYDRDGRLTGIDDFPLSRIQFAVDEAGKVTEGNFFTPLPSTRELDEARVRQFNAASRETNFSYDAQGRMRDDRRRVYSWDLAGRLTVYRQFSNNQPLDTRLTYDALGHLLTKTEPALPTRGFVWNYALPDPRIAVETKGGQPEWYYVYTPGGLLLYRIAASDNKRFYYHYDPFGNAIYLTNDSRQIDAKYAYDPFGAIVRSEFPRAIGEMFNRSVDNPFTYKAADGWMVNYTLDGHFYYAVNGFYDSVNLRFLSMGVAVMLDPRLLNPYQLPEPPSEAVIRVAGLVQGGVGVAEIVLGVIGILSPEPISTAGGIVVVGLGVDSAQAGFRMAITGEDASTLLAYGISSVAEGLGADPETAHLVGAGGDIAVNVVASAGLGLTRGLTRGAARTARIEQGIAFADSGYAMHQFSPLYRSKLYRRQQFIIEELLRAGEEGIEVPTGFVTTRMMAEITAATGKEVGLFRVATRDGRFARVLVLGTENSVDFPANVQRVHRLIAHTHPSGQLLFSKADEIGLTGLWQDRQLWRLLSGRQLFLMVGPRSILVSPTGRAVLLREFRHIQRLGLR
ncbi:MAG: RHS repeat protein [Candidatus Hydrogenedentes bacterium]|nr:RHS repeat protein [Candidatus Hydrogenedentota bacterium]